jgi:VWFA-related protein
MNRLAALSVAVIACAASMPSAQEPPRFQSGVELLRLDVSVTDEHGTPIRDLAPRDFTVFIDGKARPVRFAQLYEPSGGGATLEGTTPAAALPSFAINTNGSPGRVVVLAVDLFALKQGYEKLVLDAAARLVDSLGPNDAVGLMPITGKGVDLTRDHRMVSDALRMLRGTTNVPFIRHYFTIREAVAFEQGERRIIAETIERECARFELACPSELRDETREMLRFARQHVSTVVSSLGRLADAMQPIDAPKTIVLVSAGMPFEMETLTYFTNLQRSVARAGTLIYSVQVNQPDNDASNLRRPGVGTYQAADIQSGLANVATMSGGTLFSAIGTAAGAFARLRAEIAYSYELAVDALPQDADGKAHAVKVTVARPDVTVRARREILLPDLARDSATRLGALLAQPVDRAELPLALAAYAVRGDASDTLKVIVSAEIGSGNPFVAPVQYAVLVMKGNAVAFQTNGAAEQDQDGARAVLGAQLAPGRYRMRLAAVDGAGRGGTVELPISVGLRAAGTLQTSDLLVGVSSSEFRPAVKVAAGRSISGLIELYCTDPSLFDSVRVRFELKRGDAILAETDGALQRTDAERRQVAAGQLETADLPAGDYLVSALIVESGKPVGRVTRSIRISSTNRQ